MKRLMCGLHTVLLMALIMGLSWFPVAWADLDEGLVAHYEFEGNTNDSSVQGNHGTEHGGVNYVTGKIGKAVKFDGIDDYVEVANSSSLELNRQLTISYAFAPQLQLVPAHPGWGLAVPVVIKGRHTGNNYSSWIRGNLISVAFQQYPIPPYSSVPRYTFGVYTALAENEFVRITMLRGGGKVKIYLNCELLSEYEANYDANERHESLFIGYDGGYGYRKFKGVLDDLRIYDRALSEDEIKLLTGECEPNLVELANFTATPTQNGISLDWETTSELDTAGFFIWRGTPLADGKCTNDHSNYKDIMPLSFDNARGNLSSGATYYRTDSSVKSGTSYCYLLEDVEFDGDRQFHWNFIDSATAE